MSYSRIVFNILLITLILGITGCGQKSEIKETAVERIQMVWKENPKKSHTTFNLHWDEKKTKIWGKEIIYKYGSWNPKEVTLNDEEIQKQFWSYQNNTTSDTHYITPKAEELLLQILSYPQFDASMNICGKDFVTESHPYWRDDMIGQYINPGYVDINEFLKINSETNRKQINISLLRNTFVQMFRQDGNVLVSNCLKQNKLWGDLQGMIPLYNELIDEVRADPIEKLQDGWNPIYTPEK